MKLKIEITMDNAAFENSSGDETARILRNLADECEGGDILPEFNRRLMDINGNNVGAAKVTR
jgi:hypothetical protein